MTSLAPRAAALALLLWAPTPSRAEDAAAQAPFDASDAGLVRRWGVRVDGVRLTAAGHMLDFRYTVVDARKARPLFERQTKPVLWDEASGRRLEVPVPPKTGPLRSSNEPRAGRSYFMFFANSGRAIRPGSQVAVEIGAFKVKGIQVEGEPDADPHAAHRAAAQAGPDRRAPRLLAPQPRFDEIALVDRRHGSTTLREALDTDGPVLVNFVFTTCTTVCPIMTRGFAQLQEALGPDRERVRLVSISIDPEVDSVEALQRYAERHGAGPGWWLLTGTRESSVAAQQSFGAYRGDKMNHVPATFVRAARGAPWQVIDGLASGESLVEVVRAHGPATAH